MSDRPPSSFQRKLESHFPFAAAKRDSSFRWNDGDSLIAQGPPAGRSFGRGVAFEIAAAAAAPGRYVDRLCPTQFETCPEALLRFAFHPGRYRGAAMRVVDHEPFGHRARAFRA